MDKVSLTVHVSESSSSIETCYKHHIVLYLGQLVNGKPFRYSVVWRVMVACVLCCIHQNLSRYSSVSFSWAASGPAHRSPLQTSHLCNFNGPQEAPCFHGYHARKTNASWYNASSIDLHKWYPLRWSWHSQNVSLYPVNHTESNPNESTFKKYNFNKWQTPMPPTRNSVLKMEKCQRFWEVY